MSVYYNEFDPYAAEWLAQLMADGLIPDGVIDTRSIVEVQPDDLAGFTQCHFFAGIGGWPLAFRIAGWPASRPVWSGSCPCQPFSGAGIGRGEDDERHLWPELHRLIKVHRPPVFFGEQVASKAGREWLSRVRSDLEALGHAVGASDLCAAGAGEEAEGRFVRGDHSWTEPVTLGPPQLRPRLFIVADANCVTGNEGSQIVRRGHHGGDEKQRPGPRCHEPPRNVVDGKCPGLEGHAGDGPDGDEPGRQHPVENGSVAATGGTGGVGDGDSAGRSSRIAAVEAERHGSPIEPDGDRVGWSQLDAVWCRDGTYRRVEPGSFPLAHGLPRSLGALSPRQQRLAEVAGLDGASLKRARAFRKGTLRGYGNAIYPGLAAEFITAYMEVRDAESL